MHIINLTPLEEGVYNDHKADHITTVPEGWAMIPDDFELPTTFPRLGSIMAENITYTYDVEVEKEVTKVRDVESVDNNGNPVTITEEYKEMDTVIEQREKTIMTVTKMTEGTLPVIEEVEPEPTQLDLIEAQVTYTAMMTDTLLEG